MQVSLVLRKHSIGTRREYTVENKQSSNEKQAYASLKPYLPDVMVTFCPVFARVRRLTYPGPHNGGTTGS